MALELLAGPYTAFPVIDRRRVMGYESNPDADRRIQTSGSMLIDGRGIITHYGANTSRYLIQHDGAYALLGVSRLRNYGHYALVYEGGTRWYAESQTYPTSGGRMYALHPLTLAGHRDIGQMCPNGSSPAVRLPDGAWLRPWGSRIERHTGLTWVTEAALPRFFSGTYLSWGDAAEEFWIGNTRGEVINYNWRTRTVGRLLRTGMFCEGIWYSRKHRIFISTSFEQLDPDDWRTSVSRVRVWANTPRPASIVQTISPPPTAGRVSRIKTRIVGSDDDPCPGEAVSWAAPLGYQVVPVSNVTDEEGYALADLIVPMGALGGGDVTASVVI